MERQSPEHPGLLSALTTEHFTLQSARSSMISESLGRTTIYLGTLSALLEDERFAAITSQAIADVVDVARTHQK